MKIRNCQDGIFNTSEVYGFNKIVHRHNFYRKKHKIQGQKKESVTGYNSGPKKNLSGLQSNEKKYFDGQIKIIETRGRTKEIGEKEKLTLLV